LQVQVLPGPLTFLPFFFLLAAVYLFHLDDEQEHGDFGYEQTVFGHYNTDLQNQAAEAVRLAKLKNKRKSKKQVRVIDPSYLSILILLRQLHEQTYLLRRRGGSFVPQFCDF
jgi:CRISPR/Cas system CMR-associated protein Cmr3 (group 5 of RAMP superfamily)